MKNLLREEKGITLVALVVTIVVLVILSMITMKTLTGDNGVLKRATQTTEENRYGEVVDKKDLWQIKQNIGESTDGEGMSLEEVLEKIGPDGQKLLTEDEVIEVKKTGKVTIANKEIVFWEPEIEYNIEIGDYVDYTYDTAEVYTLTEDVSGYNEGDQTIEQATGLKWRVLNIDYRNKKIDLISETSTASDDTTDLYFEYEEGYNSAVTVINEICEKQYSNSKLKIKARSINIEDIENQFSKEGREAKNQYTVKYGETVLALDRTYYYPNICALEKGFGIDGEPKTKGLGLSDIPSTTVTGTTKCSNITITQTGYFFRYDSNNSSYYSNNIVYEMLCLSKKHYWIASRYSVYFDDGYSNIGIRLMENGRLGGYCMDWIKQPTATSWGRNLYGLRPIVTIDIDLIDGDDGKVDNVWQLKR